ncbi:hypothetical protein FQN50_006210 [Emmonsiellopsis sp. PD_5]|nr:hypothetical protein FQN50_006210 [Emmonsiellopsis sp. PD_5]
MATTPQRSNLAQPSPTPAPHTPLVERRALPTLQYCIEDVDVAGPAEVLTGSIGQAVMDGAPNFSFESNGKISFDAPQGFRVSIDLIQIGDSCIERIHSAEPLFEGSVASKLDLLRLRAVTVVDRGSDGECQDFRWLLSEVARAGQVLPGLDDEELEYVSKAGDCLGLLDRLVLGAVLGAENAPAACRLFTKMHLSTLMV